MTLMLPTDTMQYVVQIYDKYTHTYIYKYIKSIFRREMTERHCSNKTYHNCIYLVAFKNIKYTIFKFPNFKNVYKLNLKIFEELYISLKTF